MQKYNHSKTMTFLTGALAHEFNNLMTPIVLYSELLSDNDTVVQEMPEEVYELNMSAKDAKSWQNSFWITVGKEEQREYYQSIMPHLLWKAVLVL